MIGSVTELQQQLGVAAGQANTALKALSDALAATADGGPGEAETPKTYADRGITRGPATGWEPGHPEQGDFERGYVTAGHASPSPQAMPPRSSPLPTGPHGLTPVQMAADVSASQIPTHITASFTMGSPSDR